MASRFGEIEMLSKNDKFDISCQMVLTVFLCGKGDPDSKPAFRRDAVSAICAIPDGVTDQTPATWPFRRVAGTAPS